MLNFCVFNQSSIIVVYGLSEKQIISSANSGQDTTSWLKDVLPNQFPSARVMTFNYSLAIDPEDVIALRSIRKAALELLREVSQGRRMPEQREVVIHV